MMRMEELRSILTSSVEAVLNDAAAFAVFTQWMAQDEKRHVEAAHLHAAVQDFRQKSSVHVGTGVVKLARSIHRKFVSLQTGACRVLPNEVRQEMSQRVHEVIDGRPPYLELFDPLMIPLMKHFRCIHTQFVCSEAFFSHLNQRTNATSTPKPKTRKNQKFTSDGGIRHETEEARKAFVDVLCNKLADINPRLTGLESEMEEEEDEMKKTESSDDDVDNYVDKIMFEESSSRMHHEIDEECTVNSPYGIDAFAPPPANKHRYNFESAPVPSQYGTTHRDKSHRGMASDSSGFCSGASDFMAFDHSISSSRYGGCSSNNTLARSNHRNIHLQPNGFSTLPNRRRETPSVVSQGSETLTVEVRDEEGVPMVAKLPASQRHLTFRSFRRLFGIADPDQMRFFFKSVCEDGTAAYQWTLVWDDDVILPVFQGKISGICKTCPVEN
ncbi:unnamed protein product [Caenorhabditis auriculariae]|uniref:DIX domain-containing protein n=1 Tax=Caenorhabditis auriculariae TaxID=2777116 RepID=A0A8S1H1U2_9PELO|nr:unnamed protein product [Caenorhabditis auriculariae]